MKTNFSLINSLLYNENFNIKEEYENFHVYELSLICRNIIPPNEEQIKNDLQEISERDDVYLAINPIGNSYPALNGRSDESIVQFIKDYNFYIVDDDDIEEFTLKIKLIKHIKENKITIYDKEKFFEYIKTLNLKDLMMSFSNKLKNDFFVMEFFEPITNIKSNSIYMFNKDSLNLDESQIYDIKNNRRRNIDSRKNLCNFINGYNLDYNDFIFNMSQYEIDEVFKKLECIMSLIYIGNRSEFIDDNKIRISITGQTTIKFELDYQNLSINDSLKQFSKICNWIYNQDRGDSADKIEIARNIISISLDDNPDLTDIRNDLLYSIQSAHEIYLKENVEKYLEVKQDVTKNLFEIMNSIGQIANQIGDGFKTNFIAIITFFISIIISNSTADNRLNNIFTPEITIISIIFILISCIYCILNVYNSNKEIERFEQIYERSKENYEGILNPEDIKNIYNDDKYLKEDKEYISKKVSSIKICWFIFLFIITIGILLLGDFKIIKDFLMSKSIKS